MADRQSLSGNLHIKIVGKPSWQLSLFKFKINNSIEDNKVTLTQGTEIVFEESVRYELIKIATGKVEDDWLFGNYTAVLSEDTLGSIIEFIQNQGYEVILHQSLKLF